MTAHGATASSFRWGQALEVAPPLWLGCFPMAVRWVCCEASGCETGMQFVGAWLWHGKVITAVLCAEHAEVASGEKVARHRVQMRARPRTRRSA